MFKYLSIYKGKHETLSINFRTDTFFFFGDRKNSPFFEGMYGPSG